MAKNQSSNPDNEADVVNNVASDQEEKKQHRKRKPVEKKKSKHILTCVVFSLDRTELTIEVEVIQHLFYYSYYNFCVLIIRFLFYSKLVQRCN